ncbi:lytic transglycosylase domain-containing protein [Paracoccus sp. (in: a-proteobacteria)]|uniref:lytic transglycosylase domain-containing protein n=1 Tax=Paracoccus sp. TaxID=267 RepID=UPI00272AE649|nr:lytic transglycosylase domain-containing protein [Paracoccus sp. (in: a-proteobacteria)]
MCRVTILAALVLTMLLPHQGRAMTEPLPDCESLAEAAGAEAGIPPGLMTAIAHVESGRSHQGRLRAWPWTLNQGGRGSYHDSRAEAMQRLSLILASGVTNVDIGCMQINWRWHRQEFESEAAMMDPVGNTRYAARHLASLYTLHGDWTQAVAAYHAGDPSRGGHYQAKVAAAHRALGQSAPYRTASADPIPATPSLPEGGVWIDGTPEILGEATLVADASGYAEPVHPGHAAPRIARMQGILAAPQGHLLAIGMGGDLRQQRAPGLGMPPLSRISAGN